MPDTITRDMCIGEIIERHPETVEVFKKHFGPGCMTCPGADNEDVAFGALMHNADPDTVVTELNDAIKKNEKDRRG